MFNSTGKVWLTLLKRPCLPLLSSAPSGQVMFFEMPYWPLERATSVFPWWLSVLVAWQCLLSQVPSPADLCPIGLFIWARLPLGFLAKRLASYLGSSWIFPNRLVPDELSGERGTGRQGLAKLPDSFPPLTPTYNFVATKRGLYLSDNPTAGEMADLGAMDQSPTVLPCLVQ